MSICMSRVCLSALHYFFEKQKKKGFFPSKVYLLFNAIFSMHFFMESVISCWSSLEGKRRIILLPLLKCHFLMPELDFSRPFKLSAMHLNIFPPTSTHSMSLARITDFKKIIACRILPVSVPLIFKATIKFAFRQCFLSRFHDKSRIFGNCFVSTE